MTNQNTNSPAFVKTPAGSRIPKTGTLAFHPSIGFCDVIGRVGERARIRVTDFSEATDVVLSSGTISRKAWMARVAETAENTALAMIDSLDARSADPDDALYEARPLVKQMQESIISRTRGANEMLVAIDGAEAIGWEFDEYLVHTPKAKTRKGKAPAPRPQPKPVSKVGTLEDDSRPDWLVAELNETFGNDWTPSAQA